MSSSLLFSTSVAGYPSVSAGLAIADHLLTNDDTEPMDWQPEPCFLAVSAWKYQAVVFPALVAAGGPFSLPPLYTYHPLLSQQHLAAAVEQDCLFLCLRYQEAVSRERELGEVVELVKMQMELQMHFGGDAEGLRLFVERQQQQQLVKTRVDGLRQKQADQLAASASLSESPALGLSSSSSSSSSFSSSSALSTSASPPPPPPSQVKPGVPDQGNAFRGLCAPSVLSSAPASSSLSSVLPDKFARQLAGMCNLV